MEIPRPTRKGPKEDAMIAAAANGNLALVRSMLDRGADLNSIDYQGRTALMLAAFEGHLAVIQFLLEIGAPVSQSNEEGFTPLHRAAEGGTSCRYRISSWPWCQCE